MVFAFLVLRWGPGRTALDVGKKNDTIARLLRVCEVEPKYAATVIFLGQSETPLMNAPASLLMAKMMWPDSTLAESGDQDVTEESRTFDVRQIRDEESANVIDALGRGAMAGARIAVTRGSPADRVHRADRADRRHPGPGRRLVRC